MSRDIRFRVWSERNSRFVTPGSPDKSWAYLMTDGGVFRAPDSILQQFTGLLDKTGREIYEGDIVRFVTKFEHGDANTEVGEVKWDDQFAAWSFGHSFISDHDMDPKTFEIVGNIFDRAAARELSAPIS